jgi:DNA helicase-2/ATP-dependent DNA helicase PcrA
MVEKRFTVPIDGFIFKGRIDRIDLLDPSTKEVEIIDYKTGSSDVSVMDRSKQLLLYSRGFKHMYPDYQVKRLTLEMLEQEKPFSYELDVDGEFKIFGSSAKFLDRGAINSMVETAQNIAYDYEHGFMETQNPNNCRECGFKLYCEGN